MNSEPKHIGSVLRIPPRLLEGFPVEEAKLAIQEAERKQRLQESHDVANWDAFVRARGRRYAGCTLDGYQCRTAEQSAAIEQVRLYVGRLNFHMETGVGLTLFGTVGTGKDHVAAAVCRQIVFDHHERVEWVDGMTLFAELRGTFDERAKISEGEVVNRYTRAPVLAISDPLPVSGGLTEFQQSALFRIIDGRYNGMRPTIVTVNVKGKDDANARLGVPIADRLRHSSLALNFNWPSYRKAPT